MLENANFLCEIGTEEIPAGYISPAISLIETSFKDILSVQRIYADEVRVFATPRRFIIQASGMSLNQKDEIAEIKGPSVKAAYGPDGKPAKALEGFLQGNGLKIEDVYKHDTGKGEYVFAKKKLDSKKTEAIIPDIIKQILDSTPFPKKMKWSDKTVTFPRPIRYFFIMLNDKTIEFNYDGIRSGDVVRGHFIQHNEYIKINKISEYEASIKKAGIIPDHNERKEIIRNSLAVKARNAGGILLEDEELIETVAFLVENPHIVECEFDSIFLEIPALVLIAEMKIHQKYFAVIEQNGNLTNKFLVVSNNPETKFIKAGNERVIRARFNDARFFFNEDRKLKLSDRVDSLKNILFHKELGSVYDKIGRMMKVADALVEQLKIKNKEAGLIKRAIELSKTDLNTALVIEFASLQGKIGKIYALMDGEAEEIAAAIEDHYRPRFQKDFVPENIVSVVVSISEKLDNLFGSFSVGNIPKGSQDPYALRRQANAVVEMAIHNNISMNLKEICEKIKINYKDGNSVFDKILDFINGRAKTIFIESGFSHDEIDACLSINSGDYLEMFRRAKSVNEFRKDEKFSEMLLSFKRMNNIVSSFRKDNSTVKLKFAESLLEENEEKELNKFFSERKNEINKYINDSEYLKLFGLLISGKQIIDSFFDKVLVMDKRADIKENRLALLEGILSNFNNLIDFSKISDK
jgi:glycyl-tRNA synthetase beta chain